MPKQRDSSAARRSRTKSSTDEIKNHLLRQTGRRQDLGTPSIAAGEKGGVQPSSPTLTQNSRGYAAGVLGQDRWRNNSGPGPESEYPCSPLLLPVQVRTKVNAIPESSTVVSRLIAWIYRIHGTNNYANRTPAATKDLKSEHFQRCTEHVANKKR